MTANRFIFMYFATMYFYHSLCLLYIYSYVLLLYQSVIKIDVPNKWASACVQPAIDDGRWQNWLMPQSHWAPGTPRFTSVHGPGWSGEYRWLNRSAPWCTGMMPDGPGWTGGLSGGFWHVKKNRGEPWRTGKGSPTWVNRVEPCWHRRSTGKDREGSWRCRRWPGSTGMGKNELFLLFLGGMMSVI